jgi:biofilm PGA synthesis protein PgaA
LIAFIRCRIAAGVGVVATSALWWIAAAHANPAADADHEAALGAARRGETTQALVVLGTLVREHPENIRFRHDYITVLGWAGRDEEVLAQTQSIDTRSAPAYVLESAAKSARNLRRFDAAETLYRYCLAREPHRSDCAYGLAFTLADVDRPAEAAAVLQSRSPESVSLILARAYVAERARDHFTALTLYQKVLEQEPSNREARRGLVFTLDRLGAPHLAAQIADAHPGLLARDESLALGQRRAAAGLRWGVVAADMKNTPDRMDQLDAMIAEYDALLAQLRSAGLEGSPTGQRVRLDRMVALRERARMQDAVTAYQDLMKSGITVPPYAKAAAASAYLYLEQPAAARDLYLEVLAAEPDNNEARYGLFYAYVEAEEFANAYRWIDELAAATPATIGRHSPEMMRENPDRASVLSAQAMARAYGDELEEAQSRAGKLVQDAPANNDLRTDLASIYKQRGWPRRADEELRYALAAEPDLPSARMGRFEALFAMQDYRGAQRALADVAPGFPEDKRVLESRDQWRVHNLWELYAASGFGTSSGGNSPFGSSDWNLDAYLYSPPLDYNFRAYAHTYLSEANFNQGVGSWMRAGAGVEYRALDVRLRAELSEGIDGSGGVGVAASGTWLTSDQWSLGAGYESLTNFVPLQARLENITASRFFADAKYRVSESRGFGVGAQYLPFSDGNDRTILSASWLERLITGPRYKLDATVSLYGSHNSLSNAPYFNPSRDFEPALTLTNEWLTWRHYTRSFLQRLSVTIGDYWQRGFGNGVVWGARYEHVWDWDRTLLLNYGIGRTEHPYDGASTTRDYGFVTLNWRF